ncbi:lantibiotic dehydratase C-terminal domain-containing protein [Streptomyces sp. NPDC054840]
MERVQLALLDAPHQLLPTLAALCAALGRERVEQRFSLFDLDFQPFGGRYAGADASLYEPEYGKYGGPEGTRLAEAVFQESSDLALWAADFRRSPDRTALATLLMEAAVRSLGDLGGAAAEVPLDAAHFWVRHLHWWTRDAGPAAGEPQSRLRDAATLDRWGIGPRMAELAADASVTARLASWIATLTAHLREAAAAGIPRTTGHLMFPQVHMMTNRLGILPREAALLGVMAARSFGDPIALNHAIPAAR